MRVYLKSGVSPSTPFRLSRLPATTTGIGFEPEPRSKWSEGRSKVFSGLEIQAEAGQNHRVERVAGIARQARNPEACACSMASGSMPSSASCSGTKPPPAMEPREVQTRQSDRDARVHARERSGLLRPLC